MNFIYILLLILPTSISANQDSILTEGYFVTTSSSDSVQVERSTDRLTLTMKNGSNIDLDLLEGKFQHQKIFGARDRQSQLLQMRLREHTKLQPYIMGIQATLFRAGREKTNFAITLMKTQQVLQRLYTLLNRLSVRGGVS